MKILITTDWYMPAINGVVSSVLSLCDSLSTLGAEVRILTLSGSAHSYTDGNVSYLGSIGVGKIYPNARLKTAPSGKLIRELIGWRPDIVHSQCEFSTFFLAKKIAEVCGCPLVHTYHTVYEDFTHYFSPSIRFGKYIAAVFSRAVLAKANLVIAPTDKVKNMLLRYGVEPPITVIPSGVELRRFKLQISENKRNAMRRELNIQKDDLVLLYLGRLAKEKNIDELIMLLALCKDPRLKLLIVGGGPYREKLEKLASELGAAGRVIFTGMVPPCDVPDYYALGDVFVSASQSETQGLTYIEAMAAGLPLLCRADPCLSGVVWDGETGLLYKDELEFLQKLGRLSDDESYRMKLGRAARKAAFADFSSAAFGEKMMHEYQSLLNVKTTFVA